MPFVRTAVSVWIPSEYEIVSKDPRLPRKGELFVDPSGVEIQCSAVADKVRLANCDFCCNEYVIVRRKDAFAWPTWLKAEWIARDADGEWFACNEEPREAIAPGYYSLSSDWIPLKLTAFTPPAISSWRETKRRNPAAGSMPAPRWYSPCRV